MKGMMCEKYASCNKNCYKALYYNIMVQIMSDSSCVYNWITLQVCTPYVLQFFLNYLCCYLHPVTMAAVIFLVVKLRVMGGQGSWGILEAKTSPCIQIQQITCWNLTAKKANASSDRKLCMLEYTVQHSCYVCVFVCTLYIVCLLWNRKPVKVPNITIC